MAGLDPRQQRGIPIIPTYQGNLEHHSGIALKVFPHLRSVPNQYFKLHYPKTYSGIIPHQTSDQKDYLLDIGTSGILNTTKGISK